MLVCTVCSDPYQSTGRWHRDWCDWCVELNFAGSQELRLHDETPPAHAALEAYVTQPVTERQRQAMARLAARWAEDVRS